MPRPARILIADDEPEIRAMVQAFLENAGHEVFQVENGVQAVQVVRDQPFDLVVMDVIMPVMGGLEACKMIRQFSDVPVILLTGRYNEDDLVQGFSIGAFDYITKPFRPRELMARIEGVLKRLPSSRPVSTGPLSYKDLVINPRTREVLQGGKEVAITAMGYQLLEYFMQHIGEVISKADLLSDVWAFSDPVGGDNMVEAAIKRLRKELQDNPHDARYIKTIWGVGYRFGASKDKPGE